MQLSRRLCNLLQAGANYRSQMPSIACGQSVLACLRLLVYALSDAPIFSPFGFCHPFTQIAARVSVCL